MGMGFAPTWLRQVSPPPCFTKHKTTLTTAYGLWFIQMDSLDRKALSITIISSNYRSVDATWHTATTDDTKSFFCSLTHTRPILLLSCVSTLTARYWFAISVHPSVRPSRRGTVSKRMRISPNFWPSWRGIIRLLSSATVAEFQVELQEQRRHRLTLSTPETVWDRPMVTMDSNRKS